MQRENRGRERRAVCDDGHGGDHAEGNGAAGDDVVVVDVGRGDGHCQHRRLDVNDAGGQRLVP